MQKFFLILKKIIAKLPVLLFDIGVIPVAWYTAYWLRFNMHPYPSIITSSHSYLALSALTLMQVSCYYYFKTYKGLWRYFSLNDVVRILKATVTATILVIPVLYLSSVLQHLPRAVFPLYGIIITTFLCGGRLLARMQWDKNGAVENGEKKRVLIVGAGLAGEGLARDLRRSNYYLPVGFADDNPRKRGMDVHGVPVLGPLRHLEALVNEYEIELIFIAIPSARSATMRRIVNYCEQSNVPFRTLPSITALAAGRVEVDALRPVNIEDLLGRDQVTLQWDKIAASIVGKRVLVTGVVVL